MPTYVISLEEAMWGSLLVAITMVIHGTGMFVILTITESLKERFEPLESFMGGLGLVILSSLLIIFTNVLEVIVWASFFLLEGAQPNRSVALYNALLNYTTLQAGVQMAISAVGRASPGPLACRPSSFNNSIGRQRCALVSDRPPVDYSVRAAIRIQHEVITIAVRTDEVSHARGFGDAIVQQVTNRGDFSRRIFIVR